MSTQIEQAKAGIVTSAMKEVAKKEQRTPEFIRELVAAGKAVIPANHNHANLSPIGIGRELLTKINANIGNSALSSCPRAELEKLKFALKYGADTVMDLSTGGDIDNIRKAIIANSPVPIGTVPIYESIAKFTAAEFSPEIAVNTIRSQAQQGVDYMTIHPGLLRRHVPLAMKRVLGIVSRGGSLIARWMEENNAENPYYSQFDEILEICREYDVTLSLGDGLRPGCLADASDAAQFGELEVLGELVRRCRNAGVQAMVEGPGHVPFNEIEMNMKKEQELCDDAPFYILGPVVVDCAPGYDHISAAIGGTMGAYCGAAMLCYVTPREHLGLPDADDVRTGVVAFKLAAHAADVALGKPGAIERDHAIGKARAKFDWEAQFDLALDPERARDLRKKSLDESNQPASNHGSDFCTMCGPDFCSMRISSALRKSQQEGK